MKIKIGDGEQVEEKITCVGTTPAYWKAPDVPALIIIETKQTKIVLSSDEAAMLIATMVPALFKDAGKLLETKLHAYRADNKEK